MALKSFKPQKISLHLLVGSISIWYTFDMDHSTSLHQKRLYFSTIPPTSSILVSKPIWFWRFGETGSHGAWTIWSSWWMMEAFSQAKGGMACLVLCIFRTYFSCGFPKFPTFPYFSYGFQDLLLQNESKCKVRFGFLIEIIGGCVSICFVLFTCGVHGTVSQSRFHCWAHNGRSHYEHLTYLYKIILKKTAGWGPLELTTFQSMLLIQKITVKELLALTFPYFQGDHKCSKL